MIDPQYERINRLVERYSGREESTGLAWARTLALSELVRDMLTGDRDDAGVEVLESQLKLAAIVTLSSGDLEAAARHHDRLADDLEAVQPGEDPRSTLGSAVVAHRMAAEICRGDFARLRLFATGRRDGKDFTVVLRLPSTPAAES